MKFILAILFGLALSGCTFAEHNLPPGYTLELNDKTTHFRFCISYYYCPERYFSSYQSASRAAWAQYEYDQHGSLTVTVDDSKGSWHRVNAP